MAKVKIVKNESDPPLFTGKLLIKFQNILRNTTQVIIRQMVKILFTVISSPITLERQKWKSSKIKGILLSSPVNSWYNFKRFLETQLKLSYDIGFVYRRTDMVKPVYPSYNFVAGGIIMCQNRLTCLPQRLLFHWTSKIKI
jgi:hypothetical protein